jgi:hypothetical protein
VLLPLRRLLRPGGFLAVLCEPVGRYTGGRVDEDFRRELERGINEQIFTAREYDSFFRCAGLEADWVEIDRGSLKAILRPRRPWGRLFAVAREALELRRQTLWYYVKRGLRRPRPAGQDPTEGNQTACQATRQRQGRRAG